jgi:hypothetical protein
MVLICVDMFWSIPGNWGWTWTWRFGDEFVDQAWGQDFERCSVAFFDAKWCRVRLDRLHQTLDLMNRQNGCLLKSWRILFWPTPGCEWKLLCICCAYLPDFPGKTRGLRGWKFGRGAGCRDFAKITASWGRALEKLLDVGGQGLKLQCAHAGGVGWKLGWLSHVAPVKSRSIE